MDSGLDNTHNRQGRSSESDWHALGDTMFADAVLLQLENVNSCGRFNFYRRAQKIKKCERRISGLRFFVRMQFTDNSGMM